MLRQNIFTLTGALVLGVGIAGSANAAVISGAAAGACPTSTCVSFQDAGYSVTGGAELAGYSIRNRAKTPGTDINQAVGDFINDSDSITSYNIVSDQDVPTGAKSDLILSGLNGVLKVFWGSVDTHNVISFNDGSFISGLDVASMFGLGANDANGAGNFDFDAFVTVTGNFTEATFGIDRSVGNGGNGIAFEFATVNSEPVPEPLTILGTTAALAMGYVARRRKLGQQADA